MSIAKRAESIMICIANIYNTGGVIQNDDFKFIANRVEEIKKEIADVQPVKWISVKDRLPNENQKCLVYRDIDADLKITTGIWHSEWKAFDGLRHGTRLEDTIAWMPLPELPKDGDTE